MNSFIIKYIEQVLKSSVVQKGKELNHSGYLLIINVFEINTIMRFVSYMYVVSSLFLKYAH